jgi:hypothetical protein
MRPTVVERFLAGGGPAVDPALPALDALGHDELACLAPLPYPAAGFGDRAVALQLSQATDQGSRRRPLVAAQVAWLAPRVPLTSVLHPLCGPGVVAAALRDAGTVEYLGVDVNSAAVDRALAGGPWPERFRFVHGDALDAPPAWARGGGYGLGLLTYESVNAFPPTTAIRLVAAMADGLHPDAPLVAEVRLEQPSPGTARSWERRPGGSLFSAAPHLLLTERVQTEAAVVDRFVVVPTAARSRIEAFHSIVWLYPRWRLEEVLRAAGWRLAQLTPSQPFDTDNTDAASSAFAFAEREP